MSESMTTKFEQMVETTIATRAVKDLIDAGFELSVIIEAQNSDDPEDHEIWRSTDADAVIKAMGAGDEDWLKVYRPHDKGLPMGWVRFVYGNDGWDVICDYTTNLERYLTDANNLANQIERDPASVFQAKPGVCPVCQDSACETKSAECGK